ncbi:MAG: DUF4238 domain-containing protein [Proteobacteria bacterium]|nr:DUF4238 domain-containing protein [Pseudomonadota bacterium]
MPKDEKKAETQHYVPIFLLKKFCVLGKNQVWVFDKHNDNTFRTNIKNIASELNYNVFDLSDYTVDAEPIFTFIENETAPVVQKIIDRENLSDLTPLEHAKIATLVIIQFFRTRQFREMTLFLNETLVNKIRQIGGDPSQVQDFIELDENSIKLMTARFVLKFEEFVPAILDKNWILFKTKRNKFFYLSDNPVTLHNDNDLRPYGNLGLAVPGVQIYLPISKLLTLGFWCPSILGKAHENYRHVHALRGHLPLRAAYSNLGVIITKFEALISAIRSGQPVTCTHDNVTFMNSLQVTFSHRFVISCNNDFTLPKKMIEDNSEYRRGLKQKIE